MRFWNRIRSGLGRGVQSDLAEEMRLHRAMLEERFRNEGLSERAARERAAREFGPAASALEQSREQWSFAWLESVWMDIAYAVRALRRSKAFAATAVLTLGVGLGLASVAFTLFNAYVLRPLAVRDPGSLYEVNWTGRDSHVSRHTWQHYQEIKARRDVYTDVIASRGLFVMGDSRHWLGALVSPNYFQALGARIAIGRPFEEPDRDVVILGHAAWKAEFQSDPDVLGTTVRLRGHSLTVIGVAAEEFGGLGESPADFFAPLALHSAFYSGEVLVEVMGRLRPDMTEARAEQALGALAQRNHQPEMRADLKPRSTVVTFTPFMLVVFAPVLFALALVLATCCANVANMMLARGLARQREIGVRLSVGAGRGRLVRQLLTEALVISSLAGLLGVLLAKLILAGGLQIFYSTVPPEFTKFVRLHPFETDYRVFFFANAAAALAAIGAALLPAWQSTRMDMVAALRGEFSNAVRSSRLRDGLVVAQVIVCVVLLVCGSLLYRRASVFQAERTGMREAGIIDVNNPADRYAEIAGFLRTWPQAEAVALAARAPWYGRLDSTMVTPSGRATNAVRAGYNEVSPEYFAVFGIPLQSGRLFTRDDQQVAVISAATARQFWPGEDPIGKALRLEGVKGFGQVIVIGVAADVRHGWVFDGLDKTCIYLPATPASERARNVLVRLRSGDDTRGLLELRRELAARFPMVDTQANAMSMVLALQVYPFRAAAWLGWALGLIAMALSVSGMYGVMSYLVRQRAREIGIRVALGATSPGVVGLILTRSAKLTAAGLAIGGGIAAGCIRLLLWWSSSASLSLLEWDNVALISGITVAGTAAILAALGPSRSAARVDPCTVLRAD